ncbi:TolC family protein [Pontibacter cellulosilyticus]|uniref:TolC family protein n=1 Tax=Pontibacter cellulosilyticus TaxID=1720253 RepID=A0A923N7A4_9BACT|nr:TolC family protein [Pontibacter cellulosilyticus]MBC5993528.1 TolC family protein [Pontibacter cellulosilyticus]
MSPLKTAALLLTVVALLLPATSYSQDQLTLQEAIRIGLEKNYDIRIADKQEDIAENNVTLGNAGFLPNVDARATRLFSENNSRQEFQARPPVIRTGASSNNINSSVNLNWTIFDGMGMFIELDRLRALEKSGKLFTRQVVENTVADISDAYYEVVRQSRRIQALEDAIAISQQRIDLAQAQYEVGVSAKVEILRAQVDYNADRSELLRQEEALQNAKINLNQLLGREPNIAFSAIDSIQVDHSLNYSQVDNGLVSSNPLLQRLQLNRDIASLDVKAMRASRFPTIGVISAYNFSRSEAEPLNEFQAQFNRNRGYNYGLAVSLPIFNGFNINRQAQNARIALETSNLEFQREQNRLQSEVARAYSQYANRIKLLELEETNVKLAQENADIALERYRLGLLTAIELREAQRNQLLAENRLIDIKYEAKTAEIELKRLSSSLLQEVTP